MKAVVRRCCLKLMAYRILAPQLILQLREEARELVLIPIKVKLASAGRLRQPVEHRLSLQVSDVERAVSRHPKGINDHIILEGYLYGLLDGRAARGIVAVGDQKDDAPAFLVSLQLIARGLVDGVKNRSPACCRQLGGSGG